MSAKARGRRQARESVVCAFLLVAPSVQAAININTEAIQKAAVFLYGAGSDDRVDTSQCRANPNN